MKHKIYLPKCTIKVDIWKRVGLGGVFNLIADLRTNMVQAVCKTFLEKGFPIEPVSSVSFYVTGLTEPYIEAIKAMGFTVEEIK